MLPQLALLLGFAVQVTNGQTKLLSPLDIVVAMIETEEMKASFVEFKIKSALKDFFASDIMNAEADWRMDASDRRKSHIYLFGCSHKYRFHTGGWSGRPRPAPGVRYWEEGLDMFESDHMAGVTTHHRSSNLEKCLEHMVKEVIIEKRKPSSIFYKQRLFLDTLVLIFGNGSTEDGKGGANAVLANRAIIFYLYPLDHVDATKGRSRAGFQRERQKLANIFSGGKVEYIIPFDYKNPTFTLYEMLAVLCNMEFNCSAEVYKNGTCVETYIKRENLYNCDTAPYGVNCPINYEIRFSPCVCGGGKRLSTKYVSTK